MVSDFIFCHPSGPYLEPSDHEWKNACKDHLDIKVSEDAIEFSRNGAPSFIALNGENYSNNDTILYYFERMFKLLKYKSEFSGSRFEFLVDNAATHTKKDFTIDQFKV